MDLERHETENEAHNPFYSSSLTIVTHTVSVNCFCLCEADSHCSIEERRKRRRRRRRRRSRRRRRRRMIRKRRRKIRRRRRRRRRRT